jgi:hypothetical protein
MLSVPVPFVIVFEAVPSSSALACWAIAVSTFAVALAVL